MRLSTITAFGGLIALSGASIYYLYQRQQRETKPNALFAESEQSESASAEGYSAEPLIVVVGVGGVGSHAALTLIKLGFSHLRLIDFDQVTLSSLNRHVASRAHVGVPKSTLVAQLCRQLNPAAHVTALRSVYRLADSATLLRDAALVLDCIDDVRSKADLIYYCDRQQIPLVVSTGSGARLDALPLLVCAMNESINDPLIRAIRRELRGERAVDRARILCVASQEVPEAQLLPVPDELQQDADQLAVLENFRVRVMPVYSPLPCAYGALMAQMGARVLRSGGGDDDETASSRPLLKRLSEKQVRNLRERLMQFERQIGGAELVAQSDFFSARDVLHTVERRFGARHSETGEKRNDLVLVRKSVQRVLDRDNLLYISVNEAKKHCAQLAAAHNQAQAETENLVD